MYSYCTGFSFFKFFGVIFAPEVPPVPVGKNGSEWGDPELGKAIA